MKEQKLDKYIVPANGEWQNILTGLEGVCAFEIIGHAKENPDSGKYSVIHSIVLNAYNGKKGRIHSRCDYYDWKWWMRLKLRWIGTPFKYKLQIKTCSNYGIDGSIEVCIRKLLKDEAAP